MSLKILAKGIQVTGQLDPTLLTALATGALEADASAALQEFKGGRLVYLKNDGTIQLADGATNDAVGFLILDAYAGFYENKPALATGAAAITYGQCFVETDQIDTTETFAPGDKLYAGTGAKKGLVTKTAPGAGSKVIGTAFSTASAAAPALKILAA